MATDKGIQLCVLCGENPATEGDGDHLPPQCIYPKPRPDNIPWNKVPACVPCNGAGSKDDEQFKLIIGISTGEFRDNSDDVINALAKTMAGNKKLGKKILSQHKRGYGRRPGSSVLEPLVAVPFDAEAYVRVIQRIVRGLYWQQTGKILHREAEIDVMLKVPPEHTANVKAMLLAADRVSLNNGWFVYKCLISEQSSFWGLQFFDKHIVFALVEIPDNREAQTDEGSS